MFYKKKQLKNITKTKQTHNTRFINDKVTFKTI